MPPRENVNNNPASIPVAPTARRVGSIDGIAPRGFERPDMTRQPVASRPDYGRPMVVNEQPTAPQAVSATPAPASAGNNDVQVALAGQTPTAPETSQPVTFAAPVQPAAAEPAPVKKRRLRSLFGLLRRIGRRLLRRQVLIPAAVVAVIALAGWGAYAGVQYLRMQASPATIYKDALANALMTKQVQIGQQVGADTTTTMLDLTHLTSPRLSAESTTSIGGNSFSIKTYGTISDTYVSYTKLPTGLSTSTVSAATNHWVQLRKGGLLPAGINASLSNTADPRYQAFGPLLFANLSPQASHTTAQFLVDHKVYGYTLSKVHKVALGDKQALLFSGAFAADYSQIAIQSLATSEGLSVNDVQRIVDAVGAFKGGTSALYVDPGSRLPLRLVLTTSTGQTAIYDYSQFNAAALAARPTSNTDWPQFATQQLQLEAQASHLQTPARQDSIRQTDLVTIRAALTQYFAKNGFYPSLANLNNQTWIAANLPSFDPDTTRDPLASSLALLATAPVSVKATPKSPVPATPIYGYVYQPTTTTGKTCSNEITTPPDQRCSLYNLSATLSNGQPYSVKNPQ